MRLAIRRLPVLLAPLLFTACATVGPPQPPSLELPKAPLDLRAVRKGDRVTLTWTIPTTTTDRQIVRSFGATRICRGVGAELTQCGPGVGEVTLSASPASKASRRKTPGSYIDTLPREMESDDASAWAAYAVEVRNADGRSAGLSNQVRVPMLRTVPPPQDFRAGVTNQGVVLRWTNDVLDVEGKVRHVYRVYRQTEESSAWIVAGELPAGAEREVSLTDSGIEWEKTYKYRVETVSLIARNASEEHVDGDDSPEIKVLAHDVFPPAVPSGLQAVFSGPGQKAFVDLIWAPVADGDLAGYNIYRHESGSAAAKANAELVKAPAYRDGDVSLGKHYFYSVSAVDVRGNESARSEEAEESVP